MVSFFGFRLPLWLVGFVVYALWLGLGWSLKKVLFAWLRTLTSKTQTQLDDAIITAANVPLTIMIAVWGAAAVVHFAVPGLPAGASRAIGLASTIATFVALSLFVDFLFQNLLKIYSVKFSSIRGSRGFISIVIHMVIITIGTLVILDSTGVSITPIIASLGIGSLAVALALQPTFENVFSGFQILVDQSVQPGHFIRLESGEEGFVERIGWRTTWILQPNNNTVILPNKQLVNARVLNYNTPSADLGFNLELGVHYNSDLEKVQRIAIEVGEEIMKGTMGGIPDFKPLVRYNAFGASSINFLIILRARTYADIGLLKHEYIKSVSKRFQREGIVIPYPVTAINTVQEKAVVPV